MLEVETIPQFTDDMNHTSSETEPKGSHFSEEYHSSIDTVTKYYVSTTF
jgi:hypothetical protein